MTLSYGPSGWYISCGIALILLQFPPSLVSVLHYTSFANSIIARTNHYTLEPAARAVDKRSMTLFPLGPNASIGSMRRLNGTYTQRLLISDGM